MKLHVKVPLLIVLVLFAVGVTSSGVLFYYQRQDALARFQDTAQLVAATVQDALEQCMLTGDRAYVQHALASSSGNEFITREAVLAPGGVIAASSEVAEIGNLASGPAISRALVSGEATMGFEARAGDDVFRSITPVVNKADCQGCHNPQQRVLGAIDVTLDTGTLTRQMRSETILIVILGLATFVLVGGSLAFMLRRIVLNRLSSLAVTAQKLAKGDYSARSTIVARDEIGLLASTFNNMAASVEQRNGELEQSHLQLAQMNLELEDKVQKRTKELSTMSRVREELLEKLISAQEEERRRIARELHDEASQSLAALAINLENIAETLPARYKPARERLAVLKERAVATLSAVRGLALELRPSALDDLGLPSAIDWYAKDYLKKRGLDTMVQITGERVKLPSHTETMLFRIAQESLTNIVRHAGASHVDVELKFTPSTVTLRVADNGKGFDVDATLGRAGMRQNLGIHGMMERATLLGATLAIKSKPGRGTVLLVEVPIDGGNGHGEEDKGLSG